MLIFSTNGTLLGTFFFNEECWTGTASKKVWNEYLQISRVSKKNAEIFLNTMKDGGVFGCYCSTLK